MRKKIPVILLIAFLVSSIVYIVFLHKKYTNCNNNDKNDELIVDENKVFKEREYDCTFTQTYHVVNLLDGYIAEVPELSYVILDKFLVHQAISHIIPTSLKKQLENDKYYEFTYQLKGKGYIENMDNIFQQISSTELYNQADEKTKNEIYKDKKMFVYLTVKETEKKGVSQTNENICE